MKRFALILALAAAPALGDDALLTKYRGAMDACWSEVGGDVSRAQDCLGKLSDACMEGEPDGMSNLGMSQCLYAEAEFWDEKLNQLWGNVMSALRKADADTRDYAPEEAVREEKLRAAQRAWIGFRDAQCAFDYAIPGGGSVRQLYYPSCLSQMTFERVQDLLGIAEEFRGY